MRAARLLVPVTVLALLGACAGPADDAGDPHSDDGTSAPATGPSDERRIKTMSERTGDEAEAGVPPADLAACIQDTWKVAPESLEQAAVASAGAVFDATEAEVTGAMTMVIGPATAVTRYEDQGATMTMLYDTMLVEVTVRVSGETAAGYSLDGDVISWAGADLSGLTVDSVTYVDGAEVSVPGIEGLALASAHASAKAGATERVTCSKNRLVLVPVVGGVEMPGLAVTATRI